VECLRGNGFNVQVVTPQYRAEAAPSGNSLSIRAPHGLFQAPLFVLEWAGVLQDYLDGWTARMGPLLARQVKPHDLLFATSGGELAMIKLGAFVKQRTGCRLVVNLHDPIMYTTVNGLRRNRLPAAARDKLESQLLAQADLIVTTTETLMKALTEKYPGLAGKLMFTHLGYIRDVTPKEPTPSTILRIGYGGNCGRIQSPEILLKAIDGMKDVEATYVGDYWKNPRLLMAHRKCRLLPPMPHNEFAEFFMRNMDLSFVSLRHEYFGVCVPMKIFENIGMGVVTLGSLPGGDAVAIVNGKGYGRISGTGDVGGLVRAIEELRDPVVRNRHRARVLMDRQQWAMKVLISGLAKRLGALFDGKRLDNSLEARGKTT